MPAKEPASGAVVTRDVPHAVAAGNRGRVLRHGFGEADIARRSWDRDAAKVTRNVKALCAAGLDALERCS
jgi:hypothetical protein